MMTVSWSVATIPTWSGITLSVAHEIYTYLGEQLTLEAESRMGNSSGLNPQAKWGLSPLLGGDLRS